MATPDRPRWALVVWADAYDQTLPSCVPLEDVPVAVARHAVVIAREDHVTCPPLTEETDVA